jgi:hypothetical protein
MKNLELVLVGLSWLLAGASDCGSASAVKTDGKQGSPCRTASDCNEGLDCWGFNHKCEDFSKLREMRKK